MLFRSPLVAGWRVYNAGSLFEAGALWHEYRPQVVVLDFASLGSEGGQTAGAWATSQTPPPRLIALVPEDWARERWLPLLACGYASVLQQPVAPELLADCLAAGKERAL